jgi:hypothetical protein
MLQIIHTTVFRVKQSFRVRLFNCLTRKTVVLVLRILRQKIEYVAIIK